MTSVMTYPPKFSSNDIRYYFAPTVYRPPKPVPPPPPRKVRLSNNRIYRLPDNVQMIIYNHMLEVNSEEKFDESEAWTEKVFSHSDTLADFCRYLRRVIEMKEVRRYLKVCTNRTQKRIKTRYHSQIQHVIRQVLSKYDIPEEVFIFHS